MGIFSLITKHFPPAQIKGYKGGYPRVRYESVPTKKTARELTEILVLEIALARLTHAPRNQSPAHRDALAAEIVDFMHTELAAAN